jgi:putative membrane protein
VPGFAVRTLIAALGLWIASVIVPGVSFSGTGTLLFAAVLLGLVNAVVRPLVVLFTLPIAILTLGAFLLVINAAMLGLVAFLLDGFRLDGFFPALFGSAIVSFTGWVASWYVGPRGGFEVIAIESGRRIDID